MELYNFTRSADMLDESRHFVPNGIYGPRSPMFLAYGSYPSFIQKGDGCHIWDVDGNEYIDYMCSFGTNLLGLKHPAVEEAVSRMFEQGDNFTLPGPMWVPMAKKLVNTIPGSGWCVFGKNGSDVTSYAITVARVHTGKKDILTARGSYHGTHFWCQPQAQGVPASWRSHVLQFEFNDAEDFRLAVERHRTTLAAVILNPIRHDVMREQELPSGEFIGEVNALARREGFLVIMNDIRCGFRVALKGSAHHFGYDAHLNCFGKGMANGYPISAATGKPELMEAAKKVYFTGTHYFSGIPFAAAMATIDEIRGCGIIERIAERGGRLIRCLEEAAGETGVTIHITGHPSMPYLSFDDDPIYEKSRLFCGEAARRGIFFHPYHNWYVCAALTDEDIAKTGDVARQCFTIVRKTFNV
jgi:glutamate-1-semialdehyde 2,1-aminomutase